MNHTAWSVRMADSSLLRWPALPPAWSYEYGVLFKSLIHVWRMTGETRYIEYARRHIEAVINADGHIDGYDLHRYSLDDMVCGRLLYQLFQYTRDARYLKAASVLRTQFLRQPRTVSGSFWYRRESPDQVFLESAYMAIPFYVDCARRERNRPALDDACAQLLEMGRRLRDAATGLYFHGWDETRRQGWANAKSGCSRSFWSRAIGWYAMALVDSLDLLPVGFERRAALTETLRALAQALIRVQDEATGLWWQVPDCGGQGNNYLESSGSAMFIYALTRGMRHGYLTDAACLDAAERAFAGLIEHKIDTSTGRQLTLRDTCKTAALGLMTHRDGSFEHYANEPRVDNDMKGVAAFILAATEIERMRQDQTRKSERESA